MIGVSYYPWWQGDLNSLQATLNGLASRYSKPVMVVETAYPWTLQWYDFTNNIVGDPAQLLSPFPATVDGQGAFLRAASDVVRGVPGGLGAGVFYWEPDWVPAAGVGSSWENLTLFDQFGGTLDSIDALAAPSGLESWPEME